MARPNGEPPALLLGIIEASGGQRGELDLPRIAVGNRSHREGGDSYPAIAALAPSLAVGDRLYNQEDAGAQAVVAAKRTATGDPPRQIAAGEAVRVTGIVQGVGFRPHVWRLAAACGLAGDVRNDAEGVLIRIWGPAPARARFLERLREAPPPLARIETVRSEPAAGAAPAGFCIRASGHGAAQTGIVPDTATCPACLAEVSDPADRRYRHAFANCTHCGPRLSIVEGIPYDRAATSMAAFTMCAECRAEYDDPADRRFHAQPNACPDCGPRLTLEAAGGTPPQDVRDPVEAACALIDTGAVIAVKGIGGFQLMADACNAPAVRELRRRKRRDAKPFALMAPDVATIRRYCAVDAREQALLESSAAPIVILEAHGPRHVAPDVAPGVGTLGFMLPHTPLHHLLLQRLGRPVVLTSGNLSDEPQCTADADARARLAPVADHFLTHDRAIVNRVDDSVARVVAGAPRLLRRARGYAPAPLPLPEGFGNAPPLLALGGELKSTFCLLAGGGAVVSQHIGDLEHAATFADYQDQLAAYERVYPAPRRLIVVDAHPEYLSAKLGRERGAREGTAVLDVQHHHGHVASCLAENGVPLHAPPVLGIALDGLGYGGDGTLWGGELLLADYAGYRRLGHLKPVPLIGGARAVREPWRSTYAHLAAALGRRRFEARYGGLELAAFLRSRPLETLDAMLAKKVNCLPASSCGRLFDAVAGACGICRERAGYEGQAAVELEARVDTAALAGAGDGYPFALTEEGRVLDSAPMWTALLDDLAAGAGSAAVAARFHVGLARALIDMAARLAERARPQPRRVALSGGVFQNRILLEQVHGGLRARGFEVLTQARVPANDGGLALGQAAIGAAHALGARGRTGAARSTANETR